MTESHYISKNKNFPLLRRQLLSSIAQYQKNTYFVILLSHEILFNNIIIYSALHSWVNLLPHFKFQHNVFLFVLP